jgi:hypothetical protein
MFSAWTDVLGSLRRLDHSAIAAALLVISAAAATVACGSDRPSPEDRVAGIPEAQQRRVSKNAFGNDWPLVADSATLACNQDLVVIHVDGHDYALSDADRSFPLLPDDLLGPAHPKWPSNPLSRLRQEERQNRFTQLTACTKQTDPAACRRELGATAHLSTQELDQIDVEGHERLWPPLPTPRHTVDALVDAGKWLCK